MTALNAVHDLDQIDDLAYRATGHYVTGANPDRLAGISTRAALTAHGREHEQSFQRQHCPQHEGPQPLAPTDANRACFGARLAHH